VNKQIKSICSSLKTNRPEQAYDRYVEFAGALKTRKPDLRATH